MIGSLFVFQRLPELSAGALVLFFNANQITFEDLLRIIKASRSVRDRYDLADAVCTVIYRGCFSRIDSFHDFKGSSGFQHDLGD